jgi:hypothetical protein
MSRIKTHTLTKALSLVVQLFLTLLLLVLLLHLILLPGQAGAAEPATDAHTGQSLPLGTVLDSQGNPLSLPSTQQSALDYSAPEVPPVKSATKARAQSRQTDAKRSTKARRKPKTAKARLDSRHHVANDPGCRWLDNRLDHLEAKLRQRQDTPHGYQAQELRVRREEWRCLKCAAQGPVQGDHANCQYRR